MPGQRFSFGPFVVNPETGTLLREGAPVPIGYRAFLLLTAFLNRPGEVVTKSDLMDVAWQEAAVEETNLSVQIASLSDHRRRVESGSRRSRGWATASWAWSSALRTHGTKARAYLLLAHPKAGPQLQYFRSTISVTIASKNFLRMELSKTSLLASPGSVGFR